jgi:hypothetical protein
MMRRTTLRGLSLAALASASSLLACTGTPPVPESSELTGAPEVTGDGQGALSASWTVREVLIATADVNLRAGPSTASAVLHVVPRGAQVTLLDAAPQDGFVHVKHDGSAGWTFGRYYEEANPPDGGGALTSPAPNGALMGPAPGGAPEGGGGAGAEAIARAQGAMGFSYWWGHARFLDAGPSAATAGSCSGSCPGCSHRGSYGGDCSGLAAKAWQVPASNVDPSVDAHPYSTADFARDGAAWSTVPRSGLQAADALVYHDGGAGHVFLYNGGDGWGSVDAFECKGCSSGCVRDVRTASSAYHAIRRAGY